METLRQKLDRVRKFGMNEVEVFDSAEDEIQVLMAHISHLERNIRTVKEGLEEIISIANLGASGRDCGEAAEIALINTTLRQWRPSGGLAPLEVSEVKEP